LRSIYLNPPDEEAANLRMLRRWQVIQANEVRCKTYFMDEAPLCGGRFRLDRRMALSAVRAARAEGIPVGWSGPSASAPSPTR
jgi:2-oxoglutarate ferredoxin oxidoreductase subunit alpha